MKIWGVGLSWLNTQVSSIPRFGKNSASGQVLRRVLYLSENTLCTGIVELDGLPTFKEKSPSFE